jgi:hypothetical protein
MRITDQFTLKDKNTEKKLRDLESTIDALYSTNRLDKDAFISTVSTILTLFISVFKRLENNTTPAKTLLDITRQEVKDACFRIGPPDVYLNADEYVIAVLQELTK